eukprot:Phypoly_transcript_02798.p1 GENE.Phypoly_transcript_02798~~Phypoly_transcript_02798.p1  ORF type:complete len:705 (+),score=79.21 Phypoly_transcript_02798:125-2239(+)
MISNMVVLLLLWFHFLPPLHGTLLLGSEPNTYTEHTPIPLKVNKITSTRTGTPYPYYSLPVCTPITTNYSAKRDIATTLRGDHIEDSLYEIKALETIDCRVINYLPSVNDSDACTEYGEEKLTELIDKIKLNYTVHWSLDSLPGAVPNLRQYSEGGLAKFEKQYSVGFPLGDLKDHGVWINNHVDINIVYQDAENPDDGIVILGFEISPRSQWYDPEGWSDSEEGPKKLSACPFSPYERQSLILRPPGEDSSGERVKKIFWTYSVHWEANMEIEWNARWDAYLRDAGAEEIHLISIMNALIIVLFLMVPVVTIVKHTVFDRPVHHSAHPARMHVTEEMVQYPVHARTHAHDEASRPLRSHEFEETAHHHIVRTHHAQAHDEDETRWRLLGVEALRAPAFPMALSVLLGSGVHVICMMFVVVAFGICGFMIPVEQGRFTIPLVSLFLTMGILAGFCAMQTYKTFRGTHRIHMTLATAIAFPALGFLFFLASVIAEHSAKSSAALPYLVFAKIIIVWFAISIPLVLLGSFLGFLKRISDARVHTNLVIRTVHKNVWYQRPLLSILVAGVLPFGVVVIEYFFVLYSLWDKPLYDSYRYLLVSVFSLFITSASTNLVACFYQLNSGDPQWWWRPFLHGAASTVYMMVYSSVTLFVSFKLRTIQAFILYFSFALFSSLVFFLITSTVGFAACYFFVQTIYKHVHVLPVN